MIGNILITLMLPAFDRVQSAAERCEQGQRNLHLAFILAAYQHDYGCSIALAPMAWMMRDAGMTTSRAETTSAFACR
jgi:hypothetical protein